MNIRVMEKAPENPLDIESVRYGNILILQRIIKGKSWFNREPRESLNDTRETLRGQLISQGASVLGCVLFNRADDTSYTGGATYVAIIGHVDNFQDTGNSPLGHSNLLKFEDTLPSSITARYLIEEKTSSYVLGNFESSLSYPLAVFSQKALEELGSNIIISAGISYGKEVNCSAIKR